MYKVYFTKLAICGDGSIGNISQGGGTCYTDSPLGLLEDTINSHLKKQVCVIDSITKLSGFIAPVAENQSDSKTNTQQANYKISLDACRSIYSFHEQCFCTGNPLQIKGVRVDHTELNEAHRLAEQALSNATS